MSDNQVTTLEKQDGFQSQWGFIMSAVGSCVGMANIWRFPMLVSKYGGLTFLIPYFIFVCIISQSGMMEEFSLGRWAGFGPVGSFGRAMEDGGKSKRAGELIGSVPVFASLCLGIGYSVIMGWVFYYTKMALTGELVAMGQDMNVIGGTFGAVAPEAATLGEAIKMTFATGGANNLWIIIAVAASFAIMIFGISGGIEKFNNVGMPTLFVMLVVIIIRSLTLPGAMEGLKFMFVPGYAVEAGFVAETPSLLSVFASAGGQMFFSLSLAMGAMITYGSYLNQKEDLVKNSAIIVFADTLVATMAGIAVIPAAVANGIASGTPLDQIKLGGPDLLFVTLQDVFRAMGTVGALFGVIFYLLVLIAAISSAIALIEVDITYFLDRAEQKGRKGNRPKVAFLVCLAIFAVSVLVGIDGLGTTGVFPWPATAGWNDSMLDFVDMLSEGLAMPIGALMMSIMVGWEIRPQTVLDELHIGYTGRIDTFYRICIKYITPIGMLLVLAGQVNEFFSLNWF